MKIPKIKLPRMPNSWRTYNILTQYGFIPEVAFKFCRKPYSGFYIVGSGDHTPYYEASRACEFLPIKHPNLVEKYPKYESNGIPQEYRILYDIEDHYRLITGDDYEFDQKAKDHDKRHKDQMDYYKRILKHIYLNEDQIVKRFTGEISTDEIIDEIKNEVQIDLDGNPLVKKLEKKGKERKHSPKAKPTAEYIENCIKEIGEGKFPEYMPVRECADQFSGDEKIAFLKKSIRLAKDSEETAIDKFNSERVIRVANNLIKEIKTNPQMELF